MERPDVVVVGSGVGGLVAALAARFRGLDVLVVERSRFIGGTSAWSGGVLWIPNSDVMRRAGADDDSFERAMCYLDAVVTSSSPAASRERKAAYLRAGPQMVGFLESAGVEFVYADGFPDYYPEAPGGSVRGRGLSVAIFDTRELGSWEAWLRRPAHGGLASRLLLAGVTEIPEMVLAARSLRGTRAAARVLGRTIGSRAKGRHAVALGQGLIGRLLLAAQRAGVRFWRETDFRRLVVERGRVTGVVVERVGVEVSVSSRHGVILAAGGFARNGGMRHAHGPRPSSESWSLVVSEDTGDAITAAREHGAALAMMDQAFWTPASLLPDGTPVGHLWERALPHSVIVDGSGNRFCNEAGSYHDVGKRMYERHQEQPAIPSWLIVDAKHRRRYPFGATPPAVTPRSWLETGYMKRAWTLHELARACQMDPGVLESSIARFNAFAAQGRDDDYGRGKSAYDRFYGDHTVTPNPCLGPVQTPPFFAVAIYPSDVGTCGGLLTDEHARVLREDGTPIDALYAAGNTTASVMGGAYPAGGCALGPSAVFGFIAATDLATSAVSRREGSRPAAAS